MSSRTVPLGRFLPPRGLLLLASLWLAVSWVGFIGIRPPVQAQAASYTPGVRLMLLSIACGLGIAWPLVRLSGPLRPRSALQALLDLVVLLCLVQVIVWPLRLVTPWPPARAAAIDACLCGWGLFFAAIVAVGSAPAPPRVLPWLRTIAMAACVVGTAGAPFLLLLQSGTLPFAGDALDAPLAAWSPLTSIWKLSAAGSERPGAQEWRLALGGAAAALLAWIALALLRARPTRPPA